MNNLSIDELILMMKEYKINTEPVEYKRSNTKTGIVKGSVKKNKALLIKHIMANKETEQKTEQKDKQKTEQKDKQKTEQPIEQKHNKRNYMYEWVDNFRTQRDYRNDLYTAEQIQYMRTLHTEEGIIALELWNSFTIEQKLSLRVIG